MWLDGERRTFAAATAVQTMLSGLRSLRRLRELLGMLSFASCGG
jgi:hypothetical protein